MPATLEHARPQSAVRFDDGEFVDLGWRPIFKEHTNRLGTIFDRYSMEKIADRCNARITKTGDFAPICIGHTSDEGSFDPRIVGFGGPYKAMKMPDGTWAVYAKFRVYKEDESQVKRYPRCSVEYWASKGEPDAGWFDPICLLGSETPELDLGIHYCKRGGAKMIRYQAVAPGGSNTFVPSMVGDEEPQRYQGGGTLSQQDLQQIVAALQPMIEQVVKVQVAAMNPPGGDDIGDMNPLNALDDMDDGGGDELFAEPGDGDELGMGGEEGGAEGLGDLLGGDEAAGPLGDDDDDDFGDDDDTLGDGDADDDADELDLAEALPKEKSPPKKKPMKAGKDKKPAKDKSDKYSANGRDSVTVSLGDHMATEPNNTDTTVTRYQKQIADLTAERDELKTKYQKEVDTRRAAETDFADLKTRMTKIEASEQRAVFYQKTAELQSVGIVLDQDKEWERCKDMTPESRLGHIDVMRENYQKIPLVGVNTKPMPIPATGRIELDAQRAKEKRERYSKQAMENVLAARNRGEEIPFKQEFDRLLAEDPETKKTAA